MARRTSVVASPLKLPKATKGYDERDQDHTRRLIELALIAYTQQLSGVINDVAGEGVFGKDFPPVSPIHGAVNTIGDAGGFPPLVQFSNPIASGKIAVIYELWVNQEAAGTQICRLRTTDTPVVLSGVVTTALLEHRNESDTSTIVCSLQASTIQTPNPAFTTGQATFFDSVSGPGGTDLYKGRRVLKPGIHPIILLPGMALEFMAPQTGTASAARAYICFDEFPLSTTPGSVLPLDNTAPISSVWAGVRTIGSVNGPATIQFFNPGPGNAKITGLYALVDGGTFGRARRTSEPLNIFGPGATILNAVRKRMNRGSAEAIRCTLTGSNFPENGNAFGNLQAFWFDTGRTTAAGLVWNELVGPGSAPIIVKPGSAVEVQASTNGVGLSVSALVIWDEVDA